MKSNKICIRPSAIARILGIAALLLILASIAGQLISHLTGHGRLLGLIPLFYVDAEQNIPTFFSTFLLLFAALLLGVISILKRNQKASYASHWAILSFGFLYMAIDETAVIHELLIKPIHMLLGNGRLGVFYFAWVIPGIALIIIIAVFFLRFMFHLPLKTRLNFLLAASLYLGGIIGVELIGGRYYEAHGETLMYSMIATVEESLEMTGAIVFIWALLMYIAENYKQVQFQFDGVYDEVNDLHKTI